MERNERAFFERAGQTARKILEMRNPLVIHHYDADGLSSGSIIAFVLKNAGKEFRMKVVKQLDENEIESLKGEKEMVFSDIGSGQMQLVNALTGAEIAVIDHHPPSEEPAENVLMCNPHDFGIDGTAELCSASTAYYCFKSLELKEVTQLGIVGAVGDLQDYPKTGFIGLNRRMVDEGEEKKHVFVSKDLKIFGRVSRPLIWFLTYATEPFLPSLSGSEKACALFLKNNGFPLKKDGAWVSYYDLTPAQRKHLASALIEYGKSKGLSEEVLEGLVGEAYLFLEEPEKSELRDALEFSTLLNACGRRGQAEVGVSVCLKEPGALEKAKAILAEHRKEIRSGLSFAKKQFMDVGAFYFLDGRGTIPDTVIGIVAGGFFNSGIVERSKPIIAFSFDEEGKTKISGRASRTLVEKGLDLGEAMRKGGEAAGGLGGGHCLDKNTLIPLWNGQISRLGAIKENDELVSINFENGEVSRGKCTAVYRKTKEKIKIDAQPFVIECSGEHRFFTLNNNFEIVEKKAQELARGDCISGIKELPAARGKNIPEARFLGYFIGDGYLMAKKCLEFKEGDKQVVKAYAGEITDILKLKPKIKKVSKKNCFKIRAYSARICRELKTRYPEMVLKAREKLVPKAIFLGNHESKANFIGGLFDADGCIGHHEIYFDSASPELLQELQLMLLTFGIEAAIRTLGKMFRLSISNRESIDKFKSEILPFSIKKTRRLDRILLRNTTQFQNLNLIPIPPKKLYNLCRQVGIKCREVNSLIRDETRKQVTRKTLQKTIKLLEKNKADSNLLKKLKLVGRVSWCKIKKMKTIGRGELLDLTVEPHHNFIANGIIVHNSIAAGCTIPTTREAEDAFLKKAKEVIQVQLQITAGK